MGYAVFYKKSNWISWKVEWFKTLTQAKNYALKQKNKGDRVRIQSMTNFRFLKR